MEKLESILRAEDAARHAIADARTQAREILKEVRARVETIALDGERETAAEAAEMRDAAQRDAREQAAVIERDAGAGLDAMVARAQTHYDAAVEAVADALAR